MLAAYVALGKSGVGSVRTDTASICGHVNTGFSLLYNYNMAESLDFPIRY